MEAALDGCLDDADPDGIDDLEADPRELIWLAGSPACATRESGTRAVWPSLRAMGRGSTPSGAHGAGSCRLAQADRDGAAAGPDAGYARRSRYLSDMSDRTPQPDPVEVVRARIRRAGQVLLVKRADGGSLTGRFETPGGKVDAGENHRQALARELHEETGLRLEGEPVLVGVREIVSPSGREVTEFSYEMSSTLASASIKTS